MLFETHCHLTDEQFDADREEVMDQMETQGIMPCVVVGVDIGSSEASMKVAIQREWVYFAAGIHPHEAADFNADSLCAIRKMMSHPKCVAWGEIGLDYHYDFCPRSVQKEVFAAQMNAAYESAKPVILHIREAHGDIADILKTLKNNMPEGIIHCCSASTEQVRIYLDAGFYVSFSGSVTFRNASRLRETLRVVPEDRLLIETDSPYLSPEPVRGRRNDPRNLVHIVKAISEMRNEPEERIRDLTWHNGMRIFHLKREKEYEAGISV